MSPKPTKRAHSSFAADNDANEELHHHDKRAKGTEGDQAQLSPFYKLSRELRDMVYHHLWKATPTLFGASDDFFKNEFGNRQDPLHGKLSYGLGVLYDSEGDYDSEVGKRLPLWLLTSKSFFEEGLDLLRAYGEWELDFGYCHSSENVRSVGVLAPEKARHMCIYIGSRTGAETLKDTGLLGVSRLLTDAKEQTESEGVMQELRNNDYLMTLHITLPDSALGHWMQGGFTYSSSDLATTALPNLKEMVIRIVMRNPVPARFEHEIATKFVACVEKELLEVARNVLGENVVRQYVLPCLGQNGRMSFRFSYKRK